MIRVLVVSPTSSGRTALERMLRADRGLVVVRGRRTREAVEDAQVDIVVVESPGEHTLPLPLGRRGDRDAAGVVMLVDDLETETAAWALRGGARAVLGRDATAAELRAAVHAAGVGLSSVPAMLAPALLGAGERGPTPAASARATLTPREVEVLALLGEGLPNKEIALRLEISEHTVKTHLAAVYEKLGAANRAEAVAHGLRRGLILL